MKLKEKVEEFFCEHESIIDEYMRFTQLGSFLNLMEQGIREFDDEIVKKKFDDLLEYVWDKRGELSETELGKGKK